MTFRTNDWLKKLGTIPTTTPIPSMMAFPQTKIPYTPGIVPPVSNPMQQMTGRVGGIQTTAQQTQPLSAQLGGWFGQSPGQQNMQPLESLMSWLSPYLTQALSQQLAGVFGKKKSGIQSWTQALPQNITKNLLNRRMRTPR
jgi:hypothetical protein